jgi:hypothetical protein
MGLSREQPPSVRGGDKNRHSGACICTILIKQFKAHQESTSIKIETTPSFHLDTQFNQLSFFVKENIEKFLCNVIFY